MNQAESTFERQPGHGYLFFRSMQDDAKTKADAKRGMKASIWTGYVVLESGKQLQLRAIGSDRKQGYEVTVHEFPEGTQEDEKNPDAWKKVAEFKLPFFEDQNYVDGSMKIGNRPYKVRAIKAKGHMLVRLPQIANVKQANAAMR